MPRPQPRQRLRRLPLVAVALAAMLTAAGASAVASASATAGAPRFVDAERDGLISALDPPPEAGSLADLADLQAVLIIQSQRSGTEAAEAAADGALSPLAWAQRALGPGYSPAEQPRAFALFEAVRADATLALDVIKAKGPQRARPHQRDPRVQPSLPRATHESNSWPSARAAATHVWAGVLSDLFPERADALRAAAEHSAALRVIGGVHYPSEIVAGVRLGEAFLARLREQPAYRTELAAQGRISLIRSSKIATSKLPASLRSGLIFF